MLGPFSMTKRLRRPEIGGKNEKDLSRELDKGKARPREV
jgi:hypothetical protein